MPDVVIKVIGELLARNSNDIEVVPVQEILIADI
jgi:hypothetical protein